MKTYPNEADTLQILGQWQAQHDRVTSLMNGASTAFGLRPEGPLFETVWGLWNQYSITIALLIGDGGGWLEWYFLETDMGDKGMQAGYDGTLRNIDSLQDLYWLIAQSRARP